MMNRRRLFALALAFAAAAATAVGGAALPVAVAAPGDIDLDKADPRALALLGELFTALAIGDEDQSAKACLKIVHVSLMNPARNDLSKDLRRFSFKKAHDNAKFYAQPVKVTRIRPKAITGIGAKSNGTAEAGQVVDYFVAKKDGAGGLPAPVQVFFPQGGGEPKIAYLGSI